MNQVILSLLHAYYNPLEVEQVLNQFSNKNVIICRQLLDHITTSFVLLSIFSQISSDQYRSFLTIIKRPNLTLEQLQTWLDTNLEESRMVIAEAVRKSLFSISTLE